MADLLNEYKGILTDIVKKRQSKEASLPKENRTNEFDEKIRFDDDLTAAIQLFEKGHSVSDVMDALKHSPMKQRLGKDSRALSIYINRVLSKVNQEFWHKANNSFLMATDLYNKRIRNLARKYENYPQKNFGLYQDGQVALALVIKDGFSPDLVEAVLRRSSDANDADDAYFTSIRNSLDEAADRYQKITGYQKEDMESEGDIYRNYAKKYMEDTGVLLLSGADEQNILNNICTNIVRNIQQAQPEYGKDQGFIDDLMESQIKPILRKGIIEASPIYVEAGRDKDQYLSGCLSDFASEYEVRKIYSSAHYPVTQDMYLAKWDEMNHEIENYHATHSLECLDVLAAKELLDKRQSPANIVRAIMENTKYVPSEGKTKKEYADQVLKRASMSLHAEKEIINMEPYQELPEGKSFEELGLTLSGLYQHILRSRIDKTPSFQLELSEPYADRDAVEEIIHTYPDVNILSLKEAIVASSPRAQLLNTPQEYADRIVNTALKKLQRVNSKLHENAALQQEFNKLRGLATEGVYENKNPMSTLKDGRIALKMLRRHINTDDIKKYLVALAKAAAITAPVIYAGTILTQTSAVLAKEDAIRNFSPDRDAVQKSCVSMYKEKMHDLLNENEQSQPSMDIQVAKEMMKEKIYTPEQIQRVIMDNSPVAEEPGRDDHYAEYVRHQAEIDLQREQERIKRFVPVPHLEKSDDIHEEYKYQKNKVSEYAPSLDEYDRDYLIAKGLLVSGFAPDDVKDELDFIHMQDSVSESENQSLAIAENNKGTYGELLLTSILKEQAATATEVVSEALTLVRTVTTTTTTTTAEDA